MIKKFLLPIVRLCRVYEYGLIFNENSFRWNIFDNLASNLVRK